MFNVTEKLLETAEVLEKVAEIFEEEELKATELRAEQVKKDFIDPIKESLGDVPKNFETKLAALGNSDPELLDWITKSTASGSRRATQDISMGGPSIEKVASDGDDEKDAILAFVTSDD